MYIDVVHSLLHSMKKLSIEDEGDMIIALQNEITRSPEAIYDHRLQGVLTVAKEMICYDVSGILGHSPRQWSTG